jgi:hypothetical protein
VARPSLRRYGGSGSDAPTMTRPAATSLATHLGLTALMGAIVCGCILFVSPQFGSVCQFKGSSSACGSCIVERCQDAVNTCCGDPSCTTALTYLDECAGAGDQSCTSLAATSKESGTTARLGKCIDSSCAGYCQPVPDGGYETSCKESAMGPGQACSCMQAPPANDYVCSEALMPGTLCCAPVGWPAAGQQCTCNLVECSPTCDGCFCSLVDYPSAQETCSGPHCCVEPGSFNTCSCRPGPCYTYEREVPNCSAATIGCGDQNHVASCAIPKG